MKTMKEWMKTNRNHYTSDLTEEDCKKIYSLEMSNESMDEILHIKEDYPLVEIWEMERRIKRYEKSVEKTEREIRNLLAVMHFDGSKTMTVSEAELMALLPAPFGDEVK